MTAKKLSFGIVCRGTIFPAWQAECIHSLINNNLAEPQVLLLKYVKENPNKKSTDNSGKKKIFPKFRIKRDFLFSLLLKIDKKIFKPKAWNPDSLEDVMDGVPILKCYAFKKGKYIQYFVEKSVDRIKKFELDFILYFDHNIIRGDFLTSAKYGVWSFHHDDEQKYRGGSAGIWEIYFNDPENGVILQRLTDKLDAGLILNKKSLKTIQHSISLNYDQLLFSSADLLTETCSNILQHPDEFEKIVPSTTEARIFKNPANLQSIILGLILLKNNILRLFRIRLR